MQRNRPVHITAAMMDRLFTVSESKTLLVLCVANVPTLISLEE
jgi:hypothetical protein